MQLSAPLPNDRDRAAFLLGIPALLALHTPHELVEQYGGRPLRGRRARHRARAGDIAGRSGS